MYFYKKVLFVFFFYEDQIYYIDDLVGKILFERKEFLDSILNIVKDY